jgi:hypothetical protein
MPENPYSQPHPGLRPICVAVWQVIATELSCSSENRIDVRLRK